MSKKDDWFRNPNWDKTDKNVFEEKLAKSRTSFNKAQYLRIKGLALQTSTDPNTRKAGRELFLRVIENYPDVTFEVSYSFEHLGKSFQIDGFIKEAEEFYRKSITYQKEHSRRSQETQMFLAELILDTEQKDKYEEMEKMLDDWIVNYPLVLNSQIYRYYLLRAHLAMKLNKNKEAKEYAENALTVAESGKKAQLSRHPTVGLVYAKPEDLAKMKHIAKID